MYELEVEGNNAQFMGHFSFLKLLKTKFLAVGICDVLTYLEFYVPACHGCLSGSLFQVIAHVYAFDVHLYSLCFLFFLQRETEWSHVSELCYMLLSCSIHVLMLNELFYKSHRPDTSVRMLIY